MNENVVGLEVVEDSAIAVEALDNVFAYLNKAYHKTLVAVVSWGNYIVVACVVAWEWEGSNQQVVHTVTEDYNDYYLI